MNEQQEIVTTALRREAAKALSGAAYAIEYKAASIADVRADVARALTALELSLPTINAPLAIHTRAP